MKGSFKLQRHPLFFDYVMFGNLMTDNSNESIVNLYGIINTSESIDSPIGYCPTFIEKARLVAHDVLEHEVAHRTNKTVYVENELRTLGAAMFIRDGFQENFDILYDIGANIGHKTFIKPAPPCLISRNIFEFKEVKEYLDDNEHQVSDEVIKRALEHIDWGYTNKYRQYSGNRLEAYDDFVWLTGNVSRVIESIYHSNVLKIVCHFDTDLRYFYFKEHYL